MFRFDYAIRFADGTYYTGKAGKEYAGERWQAYTYTAEGAYTKIQRMGWTSATVEHV